MKTIDKLEKYVILPRINFYGGFKYEGEDMFLCEDHDTDEDYDFTVKQEIKDDVLITDLTREYKVKDRTIKEQSHLEVGLKKDEVLVYVEGTGYTIPEYNVCLIDEAISQYDLLKNINEGVEDNDTNGDEKENS